MSNAVAKRLHSTDEIVLRLRYVILSEEQGAQDQGHYPDCWRDLKLPVLSKFNQSILDTAPCLDHSVVWSCYREFKKSVLNVLLSKRS